MGILFIFLVLVAHIAGISFLEAFCMAKLVWYYDWSTIQDLILVLTAVCIIGLHYLLLNTKLKKLVVCPICQFALAGIDFLAAGIVMLLLFFPNPILYISGTNQHVLIVFIQLAILIVRCISLLKKHKKTD